MTAETTATATIEDQRLAAESRREYFDGDTGRGAGASHQTGWTALVARCVDKLYR